MTFILRLSFDETGRVSGVVERVRSGEKERFHGLDELTPLLAQMVEAEAQQEPAGGSGRRRAGGRARAGTRVDGAEISPARD